MYNIVLFRLHLICFLFNIYAGCTVYYVQFAQTDCLGWNSNKLPRVAYMQILSSSTARQSRLILFSCALVAHFSISSPH